MPDGIDLEQKNREGSALADAARRRCGPADSGVRADNLARARRYQAVAVAQHREGRQLAYLRDLGLLELEGEGGETWFAKLTASGVDVVEYNFPSPAGVARPRKYW